MVASSSSEGRCSPDRPRSARMVRLAGDRTRAPPPSPPRSPERMPLPAEVAVAWCEVRKVFDDGHVALEGVSLEVRRGEFLVILGTSGSGKTTLLKLVNRLIDPTSGEVVVGGRPTAEWDPIA